MPHLAVAQLSPKNCWKKKSYVYIDRECQDYDSCKKTISELRERVQKLAFVEAINDLF